MLAAYLAFPGSLFPDDFRLEKGWVFRKATCKTFIAHFISQIAYKDSEVVLKKGRRIIVDQRLPAHRYGGGAGPGSDAIAAAASASGIGAGAAAGGGKATAADGKPAEKKPKKVNRMAAGQKWSDTTLDEWDKSKHFFFSPFFPPSLSLSLHFCGSSKPYLHAVNICLRIVLEASASERDRY